MKTAIIETGTLVHAVWPRRLLILSDIHENSRGRHNNCQAGLLHALLLSLSPETTDLLIAGDWRDWLEEFRGRAMFAENDALERCIARFRTITVNGNHENIPTRNRAAGYFETPEIFVWHGDQLDPTCSGRGRLDVVGSAVWSLCERAGLARRLLPVKRSLQRKTASQRFETNAVYLADAIRRNKILCVSGHTHRPELVEFARGRFYANPGSWTTPERGYAVIVDGRTIDLLEIRP